MEYYKHHSIVVMAYGVKKALVRKARRKAIELGCKVTNISITSIEGFNIFYVIPDGSKEGWIDSDIGNGRRKELIKWIEQQKDKEEGWNWLNYCEFSHGEDNNEKPKICNYNLK